MPHRHRHTLHVNPLADLLALAAYLAWAGLEIAAEKLTAWWADRTPSERAAAIVHIAIHLSFAIGLIVALTACGPRDTMPGPIQTAQVTDAVKVVQP